MSAEPLPSSQPAFVDQRAGLIAFGILEIIIGCFCALMIPLMLLGMAVQQGTGSQAAMDRSMILFGVMLYGAIAVVFIWLGIGSILCRRWARALLLILSWSWLLMGVVTMGFSTVVFSQVLENTPAGSGKAVIAVTLAMFTCMFLVIPGVMTFFYQRRNVKATCEARDPVKRWADACPLPVLAASLWFGFGALCMLPMPLAYKSVMPCFGLLLTGFPAMLFLMVWALGSVWMAWAFYRLKLAAWWVAITAFALFSVSSVITFAQIDPMEVYRQMGYPQQQIDQMQKIGFISGRNFVVWTVCCMAPWLGYLFWIKKFFRRSA